MEIPETATDHSVEPVEPQIREESPSISLSDSPELMNLPTAPHPDETRNNEGPPQPIPDPRRKPSQQPASPQKSEDTVTSHNEPTNIEPPKQPKEEPKPIFETDKPADAPFKSKEADEIRNEPVPPTLKGAAAKSFGAAKDKWAGIVEAKDTQLHNTRKEHEKVVTTLRQQNEQLEKRVADLSGYESVIDFQATERFQKEFSEPLKKAEEGLVNFASQWASPEGLEELKKGIGDNNYLFAALAALQKSRPDLAVRFSREVDKIMDLREKKDAELANVKTNHTKYVDERRAEGAKKSAEFEQGLKKTITAHATSLREDKSPAFPFLVKQRPPENATPEMIQRVEMHNKQVEENLRDIEAAAKSDNPEVRAKLAVGYATAVIQSQIISALEKKLEEAQGFTERVKERTNIPDKAGGATLPAPTTRDDRSASEKFTDEFIRRR